MIKTFVLDTNILLHSAVALESFADNEIILPMAVLEELDRFKSRHDELGRNARHVIRKIDQLRKNGNLQKGVSLKNAVGDTPAGTLRILTTKGKNYFADLDIDIPDNKILMTAYRLHNEGKNVFFVSKDINVRLKANALGLQVMDFEKQKINFDELFSGCREVMVSTDEIDSFYKNSTLTLSEEMRPNEFVMLIDKTTDKHTALGIAPEKGNIIIPLSSESEKIWNVSPRSKEQRMAMELLINPKIQVVTLVGQAGSGKTLLAMAAGLQAVVKNNLYERILVSRPIVPMGNDIGYLPGGKEEKLSHWMQPIYDNLEFLMHTEENNAHSIQKYIDDLMKKNLLQLEALTYIRGRSIPKQYVIIDEAQNLTPHEVKTIISRAGENTKMILTGDAYQIDNPYLDSSSNGLSYAVERLKDLSIHGHITLKKSERSKLAAAAAEYL
ncbi:MAG: PhoH family protein [Verrucomicrobiota bacterium]|nr:PhoH family protein [Verrucomicrobiota bacterium]